MFLNLLLSLRLLKTETFLDYNLCFPVLKGNTGPALNRGLSHDRRADRAHGSPFDQTPCLQHRVENLMTKTQRNFTVGSGPLIGHLFTISFISRPIIPLLSHSRGGPPAPPSASFHLLVILPLRSKPFNPPHIIIFPLIQPGPSQASSWAGRGS